MPLLADSKTCTGCLVCVDSCPRNALSVIYNKEGHLSYKANESKCIGCKVCEHVCPVVSGFHYGSNTLKDSTPYAAWSKDEDLRSRSTSGGIFASLAKFVITNGGVAIGATLQKNDVCHISIDNVEDIYRLQGSKYVQSNSAGVYLTTKTFLQSGRSVLFSGLGCQVAALHSFLGDKQYTGELFTVDLICGGVPSRFLIDSYLKEHPEVDQIISFRNKTKYEFSVLLKNGQNKVVPMSERPLPLCGFYTELTNRYSCYDCKFNGAHRKSDITIGDYWGDSHFLEQHEKGLSIAVVHSEKGRQLLAQSNIEFKSVDWKPFLLHNPRMVDGRKDKNKTKERKNLAKAFQTYSYERLLRMYANKATWHEPVAIARKVIRHLVGLAKWELYQNRLKKEIDNMY